MTFPTTLDTFNNPTINSNFTDVGVEHHIQHSNANDAIEALEAKVGVDNSEVTTSLDYKVRNKQQKIQITTAPVNPSATGFTNDMIYADGYLYLCIATNSWVRTPMGTWV